jgi:hypothetical protein
MQSGKDYRLLKRTLSATYQQFLFHVEKRNLLPISYPTFRSILFSDKIHRGSEPTGCPICFKTMAMWKLPEEDETKIKNHQSTKRKQIKSYLKMKNELKEDEVIVVQDFTNVELSSSSRQTLCICLYTKKEDKIETNYFTFVAPESSVKNDIKFVVSAWLQLINHIQSYKSINIWSDGGSKHFKITACLIFFAALQDF